MYVMKFYLLMLFSPLLFMMCLPGCFDEKKLLTQDIETQSIVVSNVPATITENSYAEITISLAIYPKGDACTVSITSSNENAIVAGSSYVMLDFSNWDTGVPVRLYTIDDENSDTESSTISLSSKGVATYSFDVQTTDDDSFASNLSYAQIKRGIWVLGGTDGTNALSEVDFYDPVTDTWYANVTQLPAPRAYCGVVSTLNKIFVIGGLEGSSTSDKIEYYDPIANTWSNGPAMYYPRSHMGVVADKGSIGIVGGKNGGTIYQYVTEYNFFENCVYYRTTIGVVRYSVCVIKAGSYYFTMGGTDDIPVGEGELSNIINEVLLWGASASATNLLQQRYAHSGVFYNNKIYILGGIHNGTLVTDVNVYDSINDNWTNGSGVDTPDLSTGRYYGSAVQIDGVLYYLGGTTDGSTAVSTNETLDLTSGSFATETFITTTSMPRIRMGFGAVRLED